MKLSTVANIMLPGRNFDGTPWKWYDYVGWIVTTICVGILGFAALGFFGI